jgi:hypothetical protein
MRFRAPAGSVLPGERNKPGIGGRFFSAEPCSLSIAAHNGGRGVRIRVMVGRFTSYPLKKVSMNREPVINPRDPRLTLSSSKAATASAFIRGDRMATGTGSLV